MNTDGITRLSFKYLLRYRRRYIFLFSALAFGFCVVTVISSVKAGLAESLYFSTQVHYAGDIVFMGDDDDCSINRHLDGKACEAVFATIRESGIPIRRYAERTLQNDDATLFFNGEFVSLRYLDGVDWENEKPYFSHLDYVDGRCDSLDDDSIIVSEQIMTNLGLRVGDSLTLELKDRYGQRPSWTFVVSGIVKDTTLFGMYKAFIERKTMNHLLGFESDESSSIGIYLQDRKTAEKVKVTLRNILAQKADTAPIVNDRKTYRTELAARNTGLRIFVLTLPVFLTDLYQLLQALELLNYFLFIMMLLIVFASAGVTYRLILHERMKEIGTMRAIGFDEKDIRHLLVNETVFLGTLAIAAGFVFARMLDAGLSCIPLNRIPGFEIMLTDGRLAPVLTPLVVAVNIVAVYTVLFAAVFIPTCGVSKVPLVEMLSGGTKG